MSSTVATFLTKLAEIEAEYEELEASLATEEVYSNPSLMQKRQREVGARRRLVEAYRKYKGIADQLDQSREMVTAGDDAELVEMAQLEIEELEPQAESALQEVREILATDDESAARDAILEIRSGTGGDEATLFAGDLLGMYLKLAERRGWKIEILTETRSEAGGVREAILSVKGEGAYGVLRFEGGVHRVQRVPATEAQGRIHTSTATVAVLPEAEEVDIEVKTEDLKVDTYRASGAGGQHVNTTDSAVRIIHVPTGVKVECQDERSQHKNRAKAMKLLRSKLLEHEQRKQDAERDSERKLVVGSAERSEKIRTYNFPDSRVKDHRINFMIHDVPGMIGGGAPLDDMLAALAEYEKEQRLQDL